MEGSRVGREEEFDTFLKNSKYEVLDVEVKYDSMKLSRCLTILIGVGVLQRRSDDLDSGAPLDAGKLVKRRSIRPVRCIH